MKKELWAIVFFFVLVVGGCGEEKNRNEKGAQELLRAVQMTEEANAQEETEKEIQIKSEEKLLSDVENENSDAEENSNAAENSEETENSDATEISDATAASCPVQEMIATMYAKAAVNVRKGPSVTYDKIGVLGENRKVSVTGLTDTGWYRIDLGDGKNGFVSGKYLADRPGAERSVEGSSSVENSGNASGSVNPSSGEAAKDAGANNEASGKQDTDNTGNTGNTGGTDNTGNAGNVGNTQNSENIGNAENSGTVENSGSTGDTADSGNAGSAGNTGITGTTGGDISAGGTNSGDFEQNGQGKSVQLSIPVYIQNNKGEYELFCTYIDYGYVGGSYTAHASAPAGWHVSRADSGVISEQNTTFCVYLDKD